MAAFRLSRRESEILNLIIEGRSAKEISSSLGISPRTVESHTDHIRQKMGVRKRSKMAAMAVLLGLPAAEPALSRPAGLSEAAGEAVDGGGGGPVERRPMAP